MVNTFEIQLGSGGYTEFACTSIKPPASEYSSIDFTSTTDLAKRTRSGGVVDNKDMSITCDYNPDDEASVTAFEQLFALQGGETHACRITFGDTKKYEFSAWVMKVEPSELKSGEAVTFDVSLQIDGAITLGDDA